MSTKKNAAYNVAYRMFSIILPLVTAPYLSRTVGQEGVGLYSCAWSVSYIFCLVGMLGLNDYGVRTIAKVRDSRKDLDRTFSEIWQMQLIVAAATLGFWFIYVFGIAGEEKDIAFHLTLMSVSCLVSFDWCLMGLDIFKPIALRNTFIKILAAICVFIFVKNKDDLWIYAFVWSLSTLLGNLSCIPSMRGKVKYHPVPLRDSFKHIGPCAVLFISVMAVNVYRTMSKVMVSGIAGMAENGLFENAEKIVYCLSGFISAIGTVMMPKISHLQTLGKTDAIRKNMDMTMDFIMCMVCAMAFGLASVARLFAPLFYGEDFAYSGTLMIPLGFTLIFIGFANVVRTQWVLPQNRDSIFVKSVCAGAVVNIIANLALIPVFKSAGGVMGTLLAELTVPVVQFIILRKELPYGKYMGYVGIYSLIGLIMLLSVYGVGTVIHRGGWIGLGIRVFTGVVVYAALCLIWWKATKNPMMKQLFGRFRKKT